MAVQCWNPYERAKSNEPSRVRNKHHHAIFHAHNHDRSMANLPEDGNHGIKDRRTGKAAIAARTAITMNLKITIYMSEGEVRGEGPQTTHGVCPLADIVVIDLENNKSVRLPWFFKCSFDMALEPANLGAAIKHAVQQLKQ
jgi:hypothetical protein